MRLAATLQLLRAASPEPLSASCDAELLRRFCRDKDEAAFREILRRYEALVRGASRRLTRDPHAVDDAVQATFLALARKAHAIRHAGALPAWLYRVARSVTPRAVSTVPVAADPADPAPLPLDRLTAREAVAVLDEELDRLPTAHRAAVLLCAVEGNTVEDAARRLGATPGAVRGWLQRGRDRLRQRLAARGVDLSVALPLLVVAPAGATAGPTREAVVRAALAAHRPARLLAGPAAWAAAGVLVAGVAAAVALHAPAAGGPPPAPPTDAKAGAVADALVTRDGLPDGAVARIGSPRLRHAGDVVALAFSPDGRHLATASPDKRDRSVRVWDLADGTEKHRIPVAANPHEHSVRYRAVAVAFTGDGARLLVLDAQEFRAFDAATGRPGVAATLAVKTDPNQFFPPEGVIGTGFSPDAKTFAAVRRNGELLLGDTATGRVRRTVQAMELPENASYSFVNVLFTPDGAEVCVPIAAGPVRLFDTATGESRRALAEGLIPESGSVVVAFTPDGCHLICPGTTPREGREPAHALTVREVTTGKAVRTIPLPGYLTLSVSPDGKLLAVATQSGRSSEVRVLDLASGKEVQSAPLALTPAQVAFSPDSRLLAATCHYEGRVAVWDLAKNARHPQSADETMAWAHFDRRGRVVLYRAGRAVTVDWRTGAVLEDKAYERGFSSSAVSEDGTLRAEVALTKGRAGSRAMTVVVKEAATGRVTARLEGVSDYPRRVTFADRNRLLVTVTQDDVLTVWDAAAGKQLWSETYPARSFGYKGMGDPTFDAAGRRMVICSKTENSTVIDVWEVRQKTRVGWVEVPRVLLTAGIAFSPDGELVAGGAEAVTVWRVADGGVVHTLGGHAARESPNDRLAIRCAFSADGRKLLTVDGAGTIRVWEVATGGLIRTFAGHRGETTASFAPDARAVVGASSDAPVLVWDVYGLAARPPFDADRVWADLADPSAATAFRAVRELCAAPAEAVPLLRARVEPDAVDLKQVGRWVEDLSAAEYAARERASAELARQGESVGPLLREALRTTPHAETRRRLAAVVGRLERPSPAGLRVGRALDALEHLGTPEARAHLEALGRGTPGCLRTVEAQAALARLAGR